MPCSVGPNSFIHNVSQSIYLTVWFPCEQILGIPGGCIDAALQTWEGGPRPRLRAQGPTHHQRLGPWPPEVEYMQINVFCVPVENPQIVTIQLFSSTEISQKKSQNLSTPGDL